MRFPGFTDEWKTDKLSSYAKKIIKKNKGNSITNVLCNSANLGIIPQSEYFDRDIANSENTDAYYVIECGDFVYNPRKSVTAPYGPVNLYDRPESGIISPLYLCFRIKNISKDFLLRWFKGNSWHKYVYSHGDTGVRYDRVSIKDEIFLNMPILLPSIPEQEKIAKFLSLLDERIATQNKIIEDLQSLIKGLIQHLIRIGLEKGTWHNVMLSEVLQERNELNKEYYPVHSVSVSVGIVNQIEYLGRSFAAKDTAHYHVVRYGDIVYTKSPTGNQPYGIIKQSFCQNPVAVSPLYGVYDPISFEIGNILHYYFLNPLNTNNYLLPLIQKGAKNTINITNRRFLENSILLPISNDEIISVSKTLSSLSSKIELENSTLDSLLMQRRYLRSQLFI